MPRIPSIAAPLRLFALLCWHSLLLALGGCNEPTAAPATSPATRSADGTAGKGGRRTTARPTKSGELPVSRRQRDYQAVHPSVERAWYMVEISYFAVADKFKAAEELMQSADPAQVAKGKSLKEEVSQKINNELFGINETVCKLFEDAIKAQPDNPLNKVAYAIYLKPRRDFKDVESYEKLIPALELMDEAIEQWPDEASFYFLKAQMMVSGHLAHNFSRTTALEEEAIVAKWETVKSLLVQAEKYDPQNAEINYYKAQLAARFSPDPAPREVVAEILREIHAGNSKVSALFIFPPPLEPYVPYASDPRVTVESSVAVYYDQWQHYGWNDVYSLDKMQSLLGQHLRYPRDKDDIQDVMFMYYRLGKVTPFERTYFSWQNMFLEKLRSDPEIAAADKIKLSAVIFKLQDKYSMACTQLAANSFYVDPKEVNGLGLRKVELSSTRVTKLKEIVQPIHASFLKQAGEDLGMQFPLPKDPKHWAE